MKKHFFRPFIVLMLVLGVTLPALADTIRLKDGSIIRGQIVSFKNEQFTILVGTGARGRKSRITVYMEDVDSIEFDSAGSAGSSTDETSSSSSQPTYQPPANSQPSNQPTYQPPTNTQPTSANPAFFQINVRVRADNASNGWTNSGLVVRRGQRLRINASGRVSLGGGRQSTPDGLPSITDRDKLMRNQPTGGLIAVVGDDNDDFIFIGRSRDFVAQRDGVLFLGVNEGNLADNTGAFEIVIEAEGMSGAPNTSTTDDSSSNTSQPVNQPPTNTPSNTTNNQPVKQPTNNPPSSNPSFFQINVRVRGDNASNGWTNSGLVVRRGQRLRINASGRVNLGANRQSSPDGLPAIPDRDKLMRNQPTGGLIAVIGDDNDDFIFIGRGRDFVAQRDGVLFLGVNEGNLADNTGVFEVVIEAEASGSR